MRIVHYSLGFPPFRRGGMTTYCIDLILEQIKLGNDVMLLWPGVLKDFGSKCSIVKRPPFKSMRCDSIASFELVNPLPVPLLNGIRDVELFSHKKSKSAFINFFKRVEADIFHVHTLQGLPLEALEACRTLGVKTVFTTHDFFGICSMVSLEKQGAPCVDDHGCADCWSCNAGALSKAKLCLIQSGVYRLLKESKPIKALRQKNNEGLGDPSVRSDVQHVAEEASRYASGYRALRSYYAKLLEAFDLTLGNSSMTLEVFERYVRPRSTVVLNVTHGAIEDKKQFHSAHPVLQIGYLGPRMDLKGYFVLRDALDLLEANYPRSFALHVFFRQGEGEREYLISHDPYRYEDLPVVMADLDLVVVPSTRYETFGFTALEAMSFGVPVVISDSAGAKDLITDGVNGIVCQSTPEDLAESIGSIIASPNRIESMSKAICDSFKVPTIREHARALEQTYAQLIEQSK